MTLDTHEEVLGFLMAHEAGEALYNALPADVKKDIITSLLSKHSKEELADMVLRWVCCEKDCIAVDLVDRIEGV